MMKYLKNVVGRSVWCMMVLGMGCVSIAGWSADIAVLIKQEFILPGDDPANDPDAKQFTFESIEMADPGLFVFITHLEEDLGHNVKLYGVDEDVPADVISQNDLIWLTEEPGSGATGTDYLNTTTPFIFQEAFLMDEMGLAASGTDYENNLHTIELKVVEANHPITQGLPETFIYTVDNPDTGLPQAATVVSLIDNANLTGIGDVVVEAPTVFNTDMADSPIFNNVPVIITVEEGTEINSNVTSGARWVMFGYSESNISDTPDFGPGSDVSSFVHLSEQAFQLMDQTIAWALGESTEVISWDVY